MRCAGDRTQSWCRSGSRTCGRCRSAWPSARAPARCKRARGVRIGNTTEVGECRPSEEREVAEKARDGGFRVGGVSGADGGWDCWKHRQVARAPRVGRRRKFSHQQESVPSFGFIAQISQTCGEQRKDWTRLVKCYTGHIDLCCVMYKGVADCGPREQRKSAVEVLAFTHASTTTQTAKSPFPLDPSAATRIGVHQTLRVFVNAVSKRSIGTGNHGTQRCNDDEHLAIEPHRRWNQQPLPCSHPARPSDQGRRAINGERACHSTTRRCTTWQRADAPPGAP